MNDLRIGDTVRITSADGNYLTYRSAAAVMDLGMFSAGVGAPIGKDMKIIKTMIHPEYNTIVYGLEFECRLHFICSSRYMVKVDCTQASELKPRTRTEYVKVDRNAEGGAFWECARDFVDDDFYRHDECGYEKIKSNTLLLAFYSTSNLYRKVEREIEWYEDIPVGGVLCANPNGGVSIVVKYNQERMAPFESDDGDTWYSVTPLDKLEIKTLVDNAPE